MKKMAAILMTFLLCLSLAACGNEKEETSGKRSSRTNEENDSSAQKDSDAPDEKADESDAEQEGTSDLAGTSDEESKVDDSAESSSAEEGSEPSETFEVPIQTDFVAVEGLGDKYVDFDNRAFAYNGNVYRLGESTLKDMVDGGIPFEESDLNNKGNNVDKNRGTGRYNLEINDTVRLQCTFINTTKEPQKEEDCLLYSVRLYYLYIPQPDYISERNAKITEDILDSSKVVGFAFPATLTKEQLLENSSEGAEVDEGGYDIKVAYKVKAELYYGDSGYSFHFNHDTNQMKEVTIDWLP